MKMKAKQQILTLAVLLFTTLLLTSCGQECPECIEEPVTSYTPVLCVGFREYGPGQTFINPYEQQGFIFGSYSGPPTAYSPSSFETESLNNLSGLVIESNGMRVDLPIGTNEVRIQAAVPTNATELTIAAIDDWKNTIHEAVIPNDATLHMVTITPKGSDIFHITFNGGDGEALLIEICIDE
jgi:hypothetical protein